MTTELQQRIAAIKAQCEEMLRLSEKATAGPWTYKDTPTNDFVMAGNKYVCSLATLTSRFDDFSSIAHARNVSPAMARVAAAIDALYSIAFMLETDRRLRGEEMKHTLAMQLWRQGEVWAVE